MQTRSIRLVKPDDGGYRKYCRYHSLRNVTLREKCKTSKVQELSGAMEKIARFWISRHTSILDERILGYEERVTKDRWISRYREVDVVLGDDNPETFVEIKFSSRNAVAAATYRARTQVHTTLKVAWRKWARLRACVLGVAFNYYEREVRDLNYVDLNKTIAKCPEGPSTNMDQFPYVVVNARQLWEFGVNHGVIKEKFNLFDEAVTEKLSGESKKIGKRRRGDYKPYETGDFEKTALQIALEEAGH